MPGCFPVSLADSLEGAVEAARDNGAFGSVQSDKRHACCKTGLHSVGSRCEGENPSGVTLRRCTELCSRALQESQEKIVEAQGSVKPLRSCGFLTPHSSLLLKIGDGCGWKLKVGKF